VIFAVSGRVLPGGYAFEEGPSDFTTTTLAIAGVAAKAAAAAAPHSMCFTRIIPGSL
jgi:hypothetical protein